MKKTIYNRVSKLHNITDLIYSAAANFPDRVYIKYRENNKINQLTFAEHLQMVQNLSAAFYEIGIKKGTKVGILSDNNYKWLISDLAILSLGAIDVPRGSDSTTGDADFIFNHSEVNYIIVENKEQLDKITGIRKNLPSLKKIITLDDKDISDTTIKTSLLSKDIEILSFDSLISKGKKSYQTLSGELGKIRESITEDDVATIIYTSGTTATPKGVMLTHKNIMSNIKALILQLPPDENDRWLSVLPVWHIFERTLEYWILSTCGMMFYSKPTAKHLLRDFEEVKPTYMASVPRIWESLYNSIMIKIQSAPIVSKSLFKFFTKVGIIYTKAKKTLTGQIINFEKTGIIDKIAAKKLAFFKVISFFPLYSLGKLIIYRKIKSKLGGHLKGPISGGGALPGYIDDFFTAFGLSILEGYGLTETSPVISSRTFKDRYSHTVGKILDGVQVRIINDKNEIVNNKFEKGIIHVKGDLVMKGYYKDEKATAGVIQKGWLNTGDIGRKTNNNILQITGRAKDTIVLLGGENVEPSPIEAKLTENIVISQAMLVGQDKKNLAALIIPDQEQLISLLKEQDINSDDDYESLLQDEKVIGIFKKIINSSINKKTGFKPFETIKNFALLPTPFTVGEELTPSLKMKRHIITKKYHKIIEALF